MDFLTQQNKRGAGDDEARATAGRGTITAKGKHVVVIGGGDTGSDCIGTSVRQGAASITQLEILPKPPERENKALTWPDWPLKLRSSHAHEEGCDRDWAVLTKRAIGLSGKVEALECVRVEWVKGADGRMAMQEVPDSQFQLKADLVLLAMGFLGPRKPGMVEQARVALDPRGNVLANTNDYRTSVDKVFAAGDMRRGQSLVVWAIREGRQCARAVDELPDGNQHPAAVTTCHCERAKQSPSVCLPRMGIASSLCSSHDSATSTRVSLKQAPSAISARMSADTSAEIVWPVAAGREPRTFLARHHAGRHVVGHVERQDHLTALIPHLHVAALRKPARLCIARMHHQSRQRDRRTQASR